MTGAMGMASPGHGNKNTSSTTLSHLQRSAAKTLSSKGVGQLNVLGRKKTASVVKQKVVAPRPLNTPSLRLEHSGNNPLANLVPAGATSWQENRASTEEGYHSLRESNSERAGISYGSVAASGSEVRRSLDDRLERRDDRDRRFDGAIAARAEGPLISLTGPSRDHHHHSDTLHISSATPYGKGVGDVVSSSSRLPPGYDVESKHSTSYDRDASYEQGVESGQVSRESTAYRPPMLRAGRVAGKPPLSDRSDPWRRASGEGRAEGYGYGDRRLPGYGAYSQGDLGGTKPAIRAYGERRSSASGVKDEWQNEQNGYGDTFGYGYGSSLGYGVDDQANQARDTYGSAGYGSFETMEYGARSEEPHRNENDDEGGVYGRLDDAYEPAPEVRNDSIAQRNVPVEREPTEEEKAQEELRRHQLQMEKLRHAAHGSLTILRRPQNDESPAEEQRVNLGPHVGHDSLKPRPAWTSEDPRTPSKIRSRGPSEEDDEETPSKHYEGFVADLTEEKEEDLESTSISDNGPVTSKPIAALTSTWNAGTGPTGGFLNAFPSHGLAETVETTVFGNVSEAFRSSGEEDERGMVDLASGHHDRGVGKIDSEHKDARQNKNAKQRRQKYTEKHSSGAPKLWNKSLQAITAEENVETSRKGRRGEKVTKRRTELGRPLMGDATEKNVQSRDNVKPQSDERRPRGAKASRAAEQASTSAEPAEIPANTASSKKPGPDAKARRERKIQKRFEKKERKEESGLEASVESIHLNGKGNKKERLAVEKKQGASGNEERKERSRVEEMRKNSPAETEAESKKDLSEYKRTTRQRKQDRPKIVEPKESAAVEEEKTDNTNGPYRKRGGRGGRNKPVQEGPSPTANDESDSLPASGRGRGRGGRGGYRGGRGRGSGGPQSSVPRSKAIVKTRDGGGVEVKFPTNGTVATGN